MRFQMPRFHSIRATFILMLSAVTLLLQAQSATGALPPDEYEKALHIAQKKVLRENTAAQPGALFAASASRVIGRFYQIGDHWDVAVWRLQPTQMRKTSDPEHQKIPATAPLVFRYEVVEVKTGAAARVVLQVKQLGANPMDPAVEFLQIELSPQLLQAKKSYQFGARNEVVPVSPEGIRSAMTPLEMLPLDFPNVLTAEQRVADHLPELPEAIRKAAQELGYAPDLARSVWFEQDYFFGRPVQALWQHGDLWPAYLRTAYGMAILIRNGANP